MKPRDNRNWQPGDVVELLRPITGRYSGYGGLPKFTAAVGTRCEIQSGPHPAVTGRERDFYCARFKPISLWEDGVSLWVGDARKVRP